MIAIVKRMNRAKNCYKSSPEFKEMPRLSPVQEIALDVIDFIYFYDVVSLTSFDLKKENENILRHINELIAYLVEKRKFTGEKASRYKHFLLCGLEMEATYNLDRQVTSINRLPIGERWQFVRSLHENARDLLFSKISNNGFSVEIYKADLDKIINETKIIDKPNYISYNLVAKSLAYDYEGPISVHIYRFLLDLQILETGRDKKNENFVYQKPDDIFLRAMLFIEFEIMRNKLYHKSDQPNITIQYNRKITSEIRQQKEQEFFIKTLKFIRSAVDQEFSSIIGYDLTSKKKVESYLSNIGDHLCYNRMFSGNNSRWVSLFGLWYLKYFEILAPNTPKYYDLDNAESLTDQASKELEQQFNLTIDAKRIYLYIKKYDGYIRFITQGLHEIMNAPKQGFVTTCLDYYFYYHPNLSDKLLDLYDSFDEQK